MKTARVGIAFLFATCLAVLAACGGGNGADELERALQSVTENDLAIMILPQEDLGEEFADLEIDEDSGFVDNEQAADGTIDPHDTADDLEQAGRINGYELGYEAPDWFSVLEAGQGVIAVDTEVVLFEDGPAASEFLAKQVDDSLRLEGEEIQTGITLEEVETFQVVGLADEAVGQRRRISFGDAQMYGTVVGFRLDRLLGSAAIVRADDANVNSQVEEIARALEERIEGVLLGDVVGTPVPLPQAEEEESPPAAATSPTAVAPGTPTPTPAAGVSGPSCQFPEDITSYRYTMEMSMEAPELMEDLMEGLEGAGEEEEGLGAALGELFGSFLMAFTQGMTVEGAYVAPDRSWDRMTLGGKPFAEVIQIGDRSWFRLGGMDWTESGAELPSQEEGVTSQVSVTISPTSPEALCEISTIDVMSTVEGMEPQKETVNDIKALHYHIDEADLRLLAALFGEGEGAEEIPESATGTMDVWLAEDGDWPVRLEAEIRYTDEEGRPITFDVFMEIKDINDPDIEIEPPI